jgi:hypothetical protein
VFWGHGDTPCLGIRAELFKVFRKAPPVQSHEIKTQQLVRGVESACQGSQRWPRGFRETLPLNKPLAEFCRARFVLGFRPLTPSLLRNAMGASLAHDLGPNVPRQAKPLPGLVNPVFPIPRYAKFGESETFCFRVHGKRQNRTWFHASVPRVKPRMRGMFPARGIPSRRGIRD